MRIAGMKHLGYLYGEGKRCFQILFWKGSDTLRRRLCVVHLVPRNTNGSIRGVPKKSTRDAGPSKLLDRSSHHDVDTTFAKYLCAEDHATQKAMNLPGL